MRRPRRSVLVFLPLAVAAPRLAGAQQPTRAPVPLDTVRVQVASRAAPTLAALGRTVEVIDRDAIDRLPARTLGDVLARSLGVDLLSRSPASADLAIRGSSFEQVVVLVDGVRVSDDQTGHFDLDLAVPLEQVLRVEILRGPGSALYGPDAVGGVINVVTTQGSANAGTLASGASVRAQAGSFGTAGIALAGNGSARGAALAGGADLLRSDGHRPGTDYDVAQLRAGVALPTAAGRLRADAGAGFRSFGASDFYGAYPSHERTAATQTSLALDSRPSARVQTTATVAARQHADRFTLFRDEPQRYQNRHETWQLEAEGVARVSGERARGALGASADRSQLRSARLGDRHEERAALFAEATAGRADGPRLDAGLRGDWSSTFGGFASPSLAASLPLSRLLRLRASGSRGFRAPTWTERYYSDPANVGDPNLQPETFWAGEVGASVSGPRARADVAAFVRRAEGLIDWAKPVGAPAATPWRTTNVSEATFRGAELTVEAYRLLGAAWTLRASGLDFDAAAAAAYQGKYALRPITRSASLQVAAPLVAGFSASAEVAHGRRALEQGWERADARLSYKRAQTRIDLDFVNLGGADYLDAAGKPVAGRSVYVGMSWRK